MISALRKIIDHQLILFSRDSGQEGQYEII